MKKDVKMLTPPEIAAKWGCSTALVYHLHRTGRIPGAVKAEPVSFLVPDNEPRPKLLKRGRKVVADAPVVDGVVMMSR